MNEQEEITSIINLLKDDEYLFNLVGEAAPQVIFMPFANDANKNYIMVGLFLNDGNLRRDILVSVCKYVVALFLKNHILDGFDGVEIMPCLVKDGRTERILRLSILSHALHDAEHLKAEDIGRVEPVAGMTCILYKNNF